MLKVATAILRRARASSRPMTGKRRVMRSDSMRKRPMVISTRMITRAATSEVCMEPRRLVAPTISDMGSAMSWKLMKPPSEATTSTRVAMANWVSVDEVSLRSATSDLAAISRYSSMSSSRWRERSKMLETDFSTRFSVDAMERQAGTILARSSCRSRLTARYESIASSWASSMAAPRAATALAAAVWLPALSTSSPAALRVWVHASGAGGVSVTRR